MRAHAQARSLLTAAHEAARLRKSVRIVLGAQKLSTTCLYIQNNGPFIVIYYRFRLRMVYVNVRKRKRREIIDREIESIYVPSYLWGPRKLMNTITMIFALLPRLNEGQEDSGSIPNKIELFDDDDDH